MKKIKRLKAGYGPTGSGTTKQGSSFRRGGGPTGGGTTKRPKMGPTGAGHTRRSIVGAEARTPERVQGKITPGLKGPSAPGMRSAPGPTGGSGARNAPTRSPGTPTRAPSSGGGFSGKKPGIPTKTSMSPRPRRLLGKRN